jgi:ABC-2 type transport system ATP-binding protein
MRAGRIIADTTPDGLLADTGETDPDAAFLRLIERDVAAAGHRPSSRREAREETGE